MLILVEINSHINRILTKWRTCVGVNKTRLSIWLASAGIIIFRWSRTKNTFIIGDSRQDFRAVCSSRRFICDFGVLSLNRLLSFLRIEPSSITRSDGTNLAHLLLNMISPNLSVNTFHLLQLVLIAYLLRGAALFYLQTKSFVPVCSLLLEILQVLISFVNSWATSK